MQASGVGFYQTLLPGISNVTLRVRYYGYYAWLSKMYAKRIGDTDPARWQKLVRRAEAFYSLVAEAQGNETGIAGITWAGRALEESGRAGRISFADASDPGSETKYLRQAWGAYGAAYGSQLYEIDIFAESNGHEIPVPSDIVGDRLADAFAASIGDTADRWFDTLERGYVDTADLKSFGIGLPSRIPADSLERAIYVDLLFNKANLDKLGHEMRRKTLLLILAISKRHGRAPSVSELRWIFYSGVLPDGSRFEPDTGELREHLVKWRLYHANDLLHVAYEALLKFSLEVLGTHPAGVRFDALVKECVRRFNGTREDHSTGWSAFVDSVDVDDLTIDQDKCSSLLYYSDSTRVGGAVMALDALELLAVLLRRTESLRDEVEAAFGLLDSSVFRSLASEIRFLDQLKDLPVQRVVEDLLKQRVMKRHMWVAMRKLRYQRDYTFLFDSDEGRLRLRDTDGPVLTNPRLWAGHDFSS
jgi:hypothetical protein